ncbi:MAG: Holliday junction branch migration protein RuvA [Planctomycetota bacterium]
MYDHIVGEVIDKRPARVVVRAGGVGFELEVPTSTSAQVGVGGEHRLFTILHVVDGSPTLLGFAERGDRELARRLMSVSGVGKAVTLAVLSTYSPHEIAGAILRGDAMTLQRVKGVGAKTAERICLELRDHVAKLDLAVDGVAAPVAEAMPPQGEDAVAGLMTLGYSAKEARSKVEKACKRTPEASTEELLRSVLRG